MEPKKGMFGNGQTTCKICKKALSDKMRVNLDIRHADGTMLAKIEYFAPLCEDHRGEGSLKIGIEWGGSIQLDQTLE